MKHDEITLEKTENPTRWDGWLSHRSESWRTSKHNKRSDVLICHEQNNLLMTDHENMNRTLKKQRSCLGHAQKRLSALLNLLSMTWYTWLPWQGGAFTEARRLQTVGKAPSHTLVQSRRIWWKLKQTRTTAKIVRYHCPNSQISLPRQSDITAQIVRHLCPDSGISLPR